MPSRTPCPSTAAGVRRRRSRASRAQARPWPPHRRPKLAAVAAAAAVEEGSGPSSSPPEGGSGAPAREGAELEAEKGPPPAAPSRPPARGCSPARGGCPRRPPLRPLLLAVSEDGSRRGRRPSRSHAGRAWAPPCLQGPTCLHGGGGAVAPRRGLAGLSVGMSRL